MKSPFCSFAKTSGFTRKKCEKSFRIRDLKENMLQKLEQCSQYHTIISWEMVLFLKVTVRKEKNQEKLATQELAGKGWDFCSARAPCPSGWDSWHREETAPSQTLRTPLWKTSRSGSFNKSLLKTSLWVYSCVCIYSLLITHSQYQLLKLTSQGSTKGLQKPREEPYIRILSLK